jgi:hypothetical protein
MINGVLYETVEDAAKAYNVKPRQILLALNEGREDRMRVKKPGSKQGTPQPFTIEGVTFPNQKAANDALGFSYNYITQAINRNSAISLAKIAAAAREYKKKVLRHIIKSGMT